MDLTKENGRIYYEAPDGELLCEITFPDENGVAVIDHTFVSEKLRGQGMAGKLVTAAVEQIRERGLKVGATCSYAVSWLEKHPECDDIKADAAGEDHTFRPIRKKANEISADDAKKLLAEARRGILAVNGDDNYPYAIPVNYFYDEANQKIYFHGSRDGYKAEALKSCDKVCFTVIGQETVKKEPWAPFVQSAVVFGRCHVIEDPSAKEASLRRFAMKYYPSEEMVNEVIAAAGKIVQMFEIEIEHMSGKEVQER